MPRRGRHRSLAACCVIVFHGSLWVSSSQQRSLCKAPWLAVRSAPDRFQWVPPTRHVVQLLIISNRGSLRWWWWCCVYFSVVTSRAIQCHHTFACLLRLLGLQEITRNSHSGERAEVVFNWLAALMTSFSGFTARLLRFREKLAQKQTSLTRHKLNHL